MIDLEYTICFCRRDDLVLMLHRSRPPNQGKWNGLGGKIEPGESPRDSVRREVMEEAGIDLGLATGFREAGVVTWTIEAGASTLRGGMYAFVAELPEGLPRSERAWAGPEGALRWQPISWVCDPANGEVVDNLHRFLPPMLGGAEPVEYHCEYRDGRLLGVSARVRNPGRRERGVADGTRPGRAGAR
jgi:8-oxo-dGTP diphosphatase